ncbi:hypothetical protein TKK_0018655 [Trichogramma kaykai]
MALAHQFGPLSRPDNQNKQQKPSYSEMTQYFRYSTKEEAIIIDSINEDIAAAAKSLPLQTEVVAKTTASASTTKATEDYSLALTSKSLLALTTMKRQLSSPSPTKVKPSRQRVQTHKMFPVFSPKQPLEPATKRSKQVEQHPFL